MLRYGLLFCYAMIGEIKNTSDTSDSKPALKLQIGRQHNEFTTATSSKNLNIITNWFIPQFCTGI